MGSLRAPPLLSLLLPLLPAMATLAADLRERIQSAEAALQQAELFCQESRRHLVALKSMANELEPEAVTKAEALDNTVQKRTGDLAAKPRPRK